MDSVVAICFVLVMWFFFVGVSSSSSSLVILGIVGAILVDSRSKRMLLEKAIMSAGAMR